MTKLLRLFLFMFFCSISLYSQSNQDCLDCHSDPDMTTERGKKTISLWVDNSKFAFSAHGKQKCIGCHQGFDPSNIPHKEKIEPVNCQSCHKDVQKKHTFHPWMANAPLKDNCKQCHSYHNVTPVKSDGFSVGGLNSVEKCGSCHTQIKEDFKQSDHFKVLTNKSDANAPDCNYCHKYPITKSWNTNFAERKEVQNQICTDCHKQNTTNKSVLKTINIDNSRHANLRNKGKIHAAVCTECHSNHHIKTKKDFEEKLNYQNTFTSCGSCHVHIAQEYQNSIHGIAQIKGNMDAASCVSCHFEHSPNKLPTINESALLSNGIDKKFAYSSKSIFCLNCHTNDSLMTTNKLRTMAESHKWLPKLKEHFAKVSCFDCHASFTEPYLSHNILSPEKSRKDCKSCHEKNMKLKSILYEYVKNTKVDEKGLVDGNLQGAVNYVGLSRNEFLDYLSMIFLGTVIFGLLIHAYIRWFFNRRTK